MWGQFSVSYGIRGGSGKGGRLVALPRRDLVLSLSAGILPVALPRGLHGLPYRTVVSGRQISYVVTSFGQGPPAADLHLQRAQSSLPHASRS